jgi:hypothetical protein
MDVTFILVRALFRFMKQTAKDYRQQIFTIIEKIVTEKLKNC